MTDPIHLEYRAPKGGVGCTTHLALTAMRYDRDGCKTVLVSRDDSLADTFGVRTSGHSTEINDNLLIVDSHFHDWALNDAGSEDFEMVLWDIGTDNEHPFFVQRNTPASHRVFWCVDNSYVALRAMLTWMYRDPGNFRVSKYICLDRPSMALGHNDVDVCLGADVTHIDYDNSVARAIDAGLLATCPSRSIDNLMEGIE